MMSLFCLATLKILCLLIIWLQCVQVWIFLSFSNLGFIELLGYVDSYLSSKLGSICHYFFKYALAPFFSLSSFGCPITYICLVVSDRAFRLCSFFFFSFFLFRVDNLNWSTFKSTDSFSAWLSLLLIFPSEFSFQLLYFSTSEFLFRSFLEILSPYEYFLFGEKLFSCFPLVL